LSTLYRMSHHPTRSTLFPYTTLFRSPDHIWNQAAEKLAEELEERSDGRMTMELYPGGQLGSYADMIQQLESGSLDFGFITYAFLTSKSDAFSAWFALYLFDSYEAALA